MSDVPNDLRYTPSHEWIRVEDDGTCSVGISDYAQSQLGDIVFVELPTVGQAVAANQEVAVVESVKSAGDIYAPVAGEITAVNDALENAPETVNNAPYEAGWLFKIKPSRVEDVEKLLSAELYQDSIS